MKWYKHLFIYLGCVAFTEIFLAGIYLIFQICDGLNCWHIFAWQQFVVPLFALVLFLFIEAWISAEKEAEARKEWCKKIDEMLEEHEKEKTLKEIKEVIEKYKEDIKNE
jgi:hypothetical protein